MLIGAILAGADETEQQVIARAAVHVGMAFQIQDDILDVTGTTEQLGKPTGSDDKNQKATYVAFEGIDKAAEDVEKYSAQALTELHSLSVQNEFLQELIRFLIHREK